MNLLESEMKLVFQDMKQRNKSAKSMRNAMSSKNGWIEHTDVHYSKKLSGVLIDWWPTTGTYQINKQSTLKGLSDFRWTNFFNFDPSDYLFNCGKPLIIGDDEHKFFKIHKYLKPKLNKGNRR